MSTHAEIKVVFEEPSVEEDVNLRIEQEEWEDTTGTMTKSDLYYLLYGFLDQGVVNNTVDCGINSDGSITCIIYTYPYPNDLTYTLKTSYGILGERVVEEVEENEIITFRLEDEYSVGVECSNTSVEWVGNVYDGSGEIVSSKPTVTFDSSGKISLSQSVYGSLRIIYTYTRHKYDLNISKRDDALSDVFGAVAYGIWSKDGLSGISWAELTAPPNSDENASIDATCGWYVDDEVDDEEEDDEEDGVPEYAPFADLETIIDYCSQEILSENTRERETPYSSSLLDFDSSTTNSSG